MDGANFGFAGLVTEKLSEENYKIWKECLKSYFIANGLWDVVTGKETKPEEGSLNYEDWIRKNAMALHAIQISCGADTMSKFRGHESAKYEWDLLAEKIRLPLPNGKLRVAEEGSKISEYQALSKAVEEGDWKATRAFLENKHDAVRASITLDGDTVLHAAAVAEKEEILKNLLTMASTEDLELKNYMGYTPFSIAAIGESKEMVGAMLEKNQNLVKIKDNYGFIPIVAASFYSSKEMVRYLYTKTPLEMLSPENADRSGATLLNFLITDKLYDVALQLLERYPLLAFVEDVQRNYAFRLLAHKRSAFPSGNKYGFWSRWIYSCIRVTDIQYDDKHLQSSDEESIMTRLKPKFEQVPLKKLRELVWNFLTWFVADLNKIYTKKSNHVEASKILKRMVKQIPYLSQKQLEEIGWYEAIHDAIRNGITEFIDEVIESTPGIIWRKDKMGRTIFANAIVQRQEKIFSHVHNLGLAKKNMAVIRHDIFHNNFLHLAAKLSPPSRLARISGAALQMQRELEWFEYFQEVSKIVPPKYKEEVNENNKTPSELFTEEHENLVKKGEKWMKHTAASCMVVATLIAAVMFPSAFTVPGGNDERKGTPIFLNYDAFLIFVISNALSLFSSSTSLLVFLGILTARYAEKDFRKSLPIKLIAGLFTLFFSIVTMMACFSAAIFLVLQERLNWVAIPVIVFSCIPIAFYSSFQFPLFIDILVYTYGGGMFKTRKVSMHKVK